MSLSTVLLCGISVVEKKNEKERIQKQALLFVFNDFNSSYEKVLIRSNRTTVYVQQLRPMLGILYKSIMKQGPKYVTDLVVVNENSRRQFPRFQPHFTTMKYVLKIFVIKVLIFGIF